jgi:ankyrin repeat protein
MGIDQLREVLRNLRDKGKGPKRGGAKQDAAVDEILALARKWAAALGGDAHEGAAGPHRRRHRRRGRKSSPASLMAAAGAGDVAALQRWLEVAASEAGSLGGTCAAAKDGKTCPSAGAGISAAVAVKLNGARNSRSESALMLAAQRGHHAAVALLMRAGADASAQLPALGTDLERRSLRKEGRPLPERNVTRLGLVLLPDGDRALMSAVVDAPRARVLPVLRALLQGPSREVVASEVRRPNRNGRTALHLAALRGDNPRRKQRPTPPAGRQHIGGALSLAALELIRSGADPNARDERGCTALVLAAARGAEGVALVLLDAGADPTIETEALSAAQARRAENSSRRPAKKTTKKGDESERDGEAVLPFSPSQAAMATEHLDLALLLDTANSGAQLAVNMLAAIDAAGRLIGRALGMPGEPLPLVAPFTVCVFVGNASVVSGSGSDGGGDGAEERHDVGSRRRLATLHQGAVGWSRGQRACESAMASALLPGLF